MKYKTFNVLKNFWTNTYLVWDEISREAMYIDAAFPHENLASEIAKHDLKLKYILNTHGHGDHIGGNTLLKETFDAQIGIHKIDAEMLFNPQKNLSSRWTQNVVSPKADFFIEDEIELKLGEKIIKIIHTPGHSKGGVCFLVENLLFSGDTLFAGSIGRTDLPGGNYEQLISSIKQKLLILPDATKVLSGHGPETTIATEKIENPFVGLAARF